MNEDEVKKKIEDLENEISLLRAANEKLANAYNELLIIKDALILKLRLSIKENLKK